MVINELVGDVVLRREPPILIILLMLVTSKNLKYNQDGTGTNIIMKDATSTSTWTTADTTRD